MWNVVSRAPPGRQNWHWWMQEAAERLPSLHSKLPWPYGLATRARRCSRWKQRAHRRRRLPQDCYRHTRVAVHQHCAALAHKALPKLRYCGPRSLGRLCEGIGHKHAQWWQEVGQAADMLHTRVGEAK